MNKFGIQTNKRSEYSRNFFYGILFLIILSILLSCNTEETNQNSSMNFDSEGLEKVYQLKLEDIQNSFRVVSKQVLPVVTEINVVEIIQQESPQYNLSPWDLFNRNFPFGMRPDDNNAPPREYRQQGLGSGVIVRKTGNRVFVITNNHVVGNADEISVGLYDGREFKAQLVGKDQRMDLALVSFTSNEDFPIARLGDSGELQVGDWAIAVGNPLGFESTVTVGIVSAIHREAEQNNTISNFSDFIQTDAAINRGNSGGALVNIKGEIIGINSWIASGSGGSIGLGFAIPINNAKRAIQSFIDNGKVVYGWLGVSISDTTSDALPGVAEDLNISDKTGSLVMNVYKKSPADRAGLLPGDFVTHIDGVNVLDSVHFSRMVGMVEPGVRKDLSLIRYGENMKLNVQFDMRKDEEDLGNATNLWPGFVVLPLNDRFRNQINLSASVKGALVINVMNGTSADIAGLRNEDVITMVNNKPITNIMDFYKNVNMTEGNEVLLKINRRGSEIILGIVK